jgi:hypothetical protein
MGALAKRHAMGASTLLSRLTLLLASKWGGLDDIHCTFIISHCQWQIGGWVLGVWGW